MAENLFKPKAVVLLSGGLDSATVLAIVRRDGFTLHALSFDYGQRHRPESQISNGIPVTYVPARNTIFLSFALGLAEVIGSTHIFIGVNALDYSGYPDCRPEFVTAFQKLANVATKSGVEGRGVTIHAPLIHMSKAEIIAAGSALGVDYSLTSSCYDPSPDGRACGHCDSCQLRRKGFTEAGIPDPTKYASEPKTAR